MLQQSKYVFIFNQKMRENVLYQPYPKTVWTTTPPFSGFPELPRLAMSFSPKDLNHGNA